jgi:hypothetical protein
MITSDSTYFKSAVRIHKTQPFLGVIFFNSIYGSMRFPSMLFRIADGLMIDCYSTITKVAH